MWIPKTVEELEGAVQRGEVEESATLDFKLKIPAANKNRDTARDLAAMANDGGVLIYGVGEDSERRPTQLAPLTLKRQAERLTQIAQSALSPPLEIVPKPLWQGGAEGLGYLLVVVPASPSAPHQVTVDGDCRFYGRNATGNHPLTEGDVSRLYERRKRWEIDREALLDEVIARRPSPPGSGRALLHLFAKPVAEHQDFLSRLGSRSKQREAIENCLSETQHLASPEARGPGAELPSTEAGVRGWGAELPSMIHTGQGAPGVIVVEFDGLVRWHVPLQIGRFDSLRFLDANELVEAIRTFVSTFMQLYCAGGFAGFIDAGLALEGIPNIRIARKVLWNDSLRFLVAHPPGKPIPDDLSQLFTDASYRNTFRWSLLELLSDSDRCVTHLLSRLAHAVDREPATWLP
ncbi:MAG TPA: ATP-binding protein [Thermoanaerobaculia bacterium]|nr:ATP-binding protein [Thermoanaerobaculia bacterium]